MDRRKNCVRIPNESFEKDDAVIGDKDYTEDKEKSNRAKTMTKNRYKRNRKKDKLINKKKQMNKIKMKTGTNQNFNLSQLSLQNKMVLV